MSDKYDSLFFEKFLILLKTFFSVLGSKALVDSSRIIKAGSLSTILAIAILCLWPPDNNVPFSLRSDYNHHKNFQ